MKRLIVLVIMLVVGMMLVGSAEAFCVYNKTGDKIQANVQMIKYVGQHGDILQKAVTSFPIDPNSKNCEDISANFNPFKTDLTISNIGSIKALCSITMSAPKDIEVTKENNQYFCSQKN